MDRIRDVRPPGSPHAAYPNAPQVVTRLLSNAVAGPNGCLIWSRATDYNNYAKAKVGKKVVSVHRAIYQLLVAPLEDKAVIDHACHNRDDACAGGDTCLHRRCINPHHLDPVSNRENQLRSSHSLGGQNIRKTHCPQGHLYDEVNTRVTAAGKRSCRECGRIRRRAQRADARSLRLAHATAVTQ